MGKGARHGIWLALSQINPANPLPILSRTADRYEDSDERTIADYSRA